MGCSKGECVQVDLPTEPQTYTTISYKLSQCRPTIFKFQSVKSSIIREQVRLENEARRQQKIAEKKEEFRQMKEANPALEIDEMVFIGINITYFFPDTIISNEILINRSRFRRRYSITRNLRT